MIRRIGIQQYRNATTRHGVRSQQGCHVGFLHELHDAVHQGLTCGLRASRTQTREAIGIAKNGAHVVVTRDDPGTQVGIELNPFLGSQPREDRVRARNGRLLAVNQVINH